MTTKTKIHQARSEKKSYQPPTLKKVGSLKTITLKSGSNTDGGMPRTV